MFLIRGTLTFSPFYFLVSWCLDISIFIMLKKHFVFTFYKSGKSKERNAKAETKKIKIDINYRGHIWITLLKFINVYQHWYNKRKKVSSLSEISL